VIQPTRKVHDLIGELISLGYPYCASEPEFRPHGVFSTYVAMPTPTLIGCERIVNKIGLENRLLRDCRAVSGGCNSLPPAKGHYPANSLNINVSPCSINSGSVPLWAFMPVIIFRGIPMPIFSKYP